MMRMSRIAVFLILASLIVPAAVLACDGDGGNCACQRSAAHEAMIAEAGKLADQAEGGCQSSMTSLIALAKNSGDEKAVALATKAEGGCEHSKAELIAMAHKLDEKQQATQLASYSPEMVELAGKAKHGCSQSMASLIETAKKSDDAQTAELAKMADGGCEHSKTELIARVEGTPSETETK